jgi:TatA/E family protein of Tat protein translocase
VGRQPFGPAYPAARETIAMMGISIWKILLFLLIILLLFSSRLPDLARSFGQSIVEFKKGLKELEVTSDDEKSEHKS